MFTFLSKAKRLEKLLESLKADYERLKLKSQSLEQLAHFDHLTNLPNRFQFENEMRRAIARSERHGHKFALLFIDVDDFKTTNDNLGHNFGDTLLIEIAKRLQSSLRAGDFIARLGGDEFAVILHEIKHSNDAGVASERITKIIKQAFNIEGHELKISISIGISVFPFSARDSITLINNADRAMYRAKKLGRNKYQYFTYQLQQLYMHRKNIETLLRKAIRKNEFSLVYQPIINIKTKKIIGVETLLRWRNEKLGLVAPAVFIQIAEETGQMFKIGDWILDNALQQYKKWIQKGHKDLLFAINLSSLQIKQSDLSAKIKNTLKETSLSPNKIGFELVESTVMENKFEYEQSLKALHNMGFQILIDDFGTGYSSLNRLKKLPIDILKIDRSFIYDIGKNTKDSEANAIITKTIIALAHSLKLTVIAEGVETKEQLDFLIKNNCDFAQGFYLAKPTDPKTIENLLQTTQKEKALNNI